MYSRYQKVDGKVRRKTGARSEVGPLNRKEDKSEMVWKGHKWMARRGDRSSRGSARLGEVQ
ncbi:MAG: hypothetical protein ACK5Z3_13265 [Pseudanabaena sp.]